MMYCYKSSMPRQMPVKLPSVCLTTSIPESNLLHNNVAWPIGYLIVLDEPKYVEMLIDV